MISRFLDKLSWAYLVPIALALGLAPFRPEPHLFEKFRMLANGSLVKPIDIFDLCMHGAPLLLIIAKLVFRPAIPSKD